MLQQLMRGDSIPLDDSHHVNLLRRVDIPDIVKMLSDLRMTEYLFFAPAPVEVYEGYFSPLAEAIANARQKDMLPESVILIVRDAKTEEFVGNAGLVATMLCPGNFEVGFQIRSEFQRRGIATAAARMLTRIAFDELHAHKICADIYEENVASACVLQKLGYVREGCLDSYYRMERGFDNKVFFGLTAKQYAERFRENTP